MNDPRALHVERTAVPETLRWVVHSDALSASESGRRRPPPSSPLGRLSGSITTITAVGPNLDITAADAAAWRDLAPAVRDALVAELNALDDGESSWLVEPVATDPAPLPSIVAVQAVVDRTAGKLAASHGGSLTVIGVGPDSVTVQPGGACRGCNQSADTMLELVTPAVRAAFPAVVAVVLDEPPTAPLRVQFLGSNNRRTIGS